MKATLKQPRFKYILLELEQEGTKLTQQEIARRLGVSQEAVSKWFRGDTTPTLTKAFALSKILERPIEDLYEVVYEEDEGQ